jgi:hypothetical protein
MNRLNSDIQNWYSQIDDDDIQLALSLIYTKLDKQKDPKVPKLMSKLVRMDQRIKTSNKAPGSTWWKYFLWEAKNS